LIQFESGKKEKGEGEGKSLKVEKGGSVFVKIDKKNDGSKKITLNNISYNNNMSLL